MKALIKSFVKKLPRRSKRNKTKQKNKKEGFLKKVIIELQRSEWLDFKEWLQHLIFVILFSGLIVLVILIIDLVFFKIRDRYILGKESIVDNLGLLFNNLMEWLKSIF